MANSPFDKDLFTPNHAKGYGVDGWDDYIAKVLESKGMPSRGDFDPLGKYYRFKPWIVYDNPESGREFLFFIKPDLYIVNNYIQNGASLQSNLANYPFFKEVARKYPKVIGQLQFQADKNRYPYSLLLSNMVASNLDMPGLSANTVTTATNLFGTNYEYRGTSEPSDDNYDFSLEFSDTRWLDTYMYFRTYEEYERLKAQGVIRLNESRGGVLNYYKYIDNRVLHDDIGIFKFIVAEDMETILYYAYFCGVAWKSLPRDSFNNADFSDGIKYGIDAKAAFVEDMNPIILQDFNFLNKQYIDNTGGMSSYKYAHMVNYKVSPEADLSPVTIPYVFKSRLHGKDTYKLGFLRKK
jgi:hypothetical protein